MKNKNVTVKSQKAQSAMEYILLAAAVVIFLLIFLSPTGLFRNQIENGINQSIDQIILMTDRTDFTSGIQPGGPGSGGQPPPPPPLDECEKEYTRNSCLSRTRPPYCVWKVSVNDFCANSFEQCVSRNSFNANDDNTTTIQHCIAGKYPSYSQLRCVDNSSSSQPTYSTLCYVYADPNATCVSCLNGPQCSMGDCDGLNQFDCVANCGCCQYHNVTQTCNFFGSNLHDCIRY